ARVDDRLPGGSGRRGVRRERRVRLGDGRPHPRAVPPPITVTRESPPSHERLPALPRETSRPSSGRRGPSRGGDPLLTGRGSSPHGAGILSLALVEEGVDEVLCHERREVVGSLAEAHELDGYAELAL